MKRQIDPGLDNLTDDELFGELESAPEEKLSASPSHKMVLTDDKGVEIPLNDNREEAKLTISQADKPAEHRSSHHHSSHHHSSSHHSHSGSHSHSHHSSSHHSHSSHSHSSSGKSGKKKKKSRTPIGVRIVLGIFIFLLAAVLAVVGAFVYLQKSGNRDLTRIPSESAYEEVIEYKGETYKYNKNIVSIAFIGVDKRELGLVDGAVGTAGQADADILLTIDTATGRARAIAIPRDTMVDVDIYSVNNIFLRTENMQLCLSYAYGNGTNTSAANTTTSVSRILYNVPIHKYFALDLDGIRPINDSIGGVTVTSLYDFEKLGIHKGDEILLKGDLTEQYVRTRDMDTVEASLNRTARQTQYIRAFTSQLAPKVITDFSIVTRLYNTASEYSTTNISLSNATYLGTLLLQKGITDFETVTLEGEMKASKSKENSGIVYAEFYPDEDKLMELVLDTFYKKAN